MVKGKILGDEATSWSTFPVASGMMVLLMGTKDEDVQTAPVEQVKFLEDMDESEIATAVSYVYA